MLQVNKMRKIKMDRIRRGLGLLSFDNLVKYFDVTTLKRIVASGEPYHLYKYIDVNYEKNTRAARERKLKITFKPKNSKSNNSFLPRSVRSYNLLPVEIKQLSGKKFNDAVRNYYFEKENQKPLSCAVS